MNTRSGRLKLAVAIVVILMAAALVVWLIVNPPRPTSETTPNPDTVPVAGAVENLTINLTLEGYVDNGDGTFTVDYRYFIHNPNSFVVREVLATSQFSQAVPGGPQVEVLELDSNRFAVNSGFDGINNTRLLPVNTVLQPREGGIINLKVRMVYGPGQPSVKNAAMISGVNGGGTATASSTMGTSSGATSTMTSASSSSANDNPAAGSDEVDFSISLNSTSYTLPAGRRK